MVADAWETKKVLITARTYPTPARKGVEVSCTGAISDSGEWIRLFPIPYRFLSMDKRFRKYQWIEVRARRAQSDPRPESYEVDIDSIRVLSEPLSTGSKWEARKKLIMPLQANSLCELQRQRNQNGNPTLGFFKPKTIERLIIEKDNPDWSDADVARLNQYSLFANAPKIQLEKIPFKFLYRFYCDDAGCNGHRLSSTDWEMAQAYRRWRESYGDDHWETAFRNRFEYEMIDKNDTHFFVGTVRIHPASWIIVGLFYPRR